MRRGFSLIELMFAVAIGLFVVGALYALFNGQMKSLVYQDLQAEMHQNARMSLDILSRTLRNGGLGTSSTTVGVFGAGGDPDQPLPALTHYNNTGPNGSDALTIVTMEPALVISTWGDSPPACGTTALEFSTSVARNTARLPQYRSNDLVMCYDYAAIGGFRSWLWRVTTDGDATTGQLSVAPNSGYTDFVSDCGPTDNLPLISVCSRAEVATFYIDADDTDGMGPGSSRHPVLMMDLDFDSPSANDVPIVDNVEDLQVSWCLDDGDPSTDVSCDASWQTTLNAAQVSLVYMARITVVVRSSREDLRELYPGERPTIEDNVTTGTSDHYLRTVLSTDVTVRNLRIQGLL